MDKQQEDTGSVVDGMPTDEEGFTDAEAAAMEQPDTDFAKRLQKSSSYDPGGYGTAYKPSRDVGQKQQKLTTGNIPTDNVTGRGGNGQDGVRCLTGPVTQPTVTVKGARATVQDKERAEKLFPPDDEPRRTIIEDNIRLIVQVRKKPGTYRYVILTGYTEVDLSDVVNLFISMNPPYWKCAGGPTVTPTGLFAQAMASVGMV